MSLSPQTTSLRKDATSGLAMLAGTGVTTPTQCPESQGVSTGTGTMTRRRSPATAAYRCIICS